MSDFYLGLCREHPLLEYIEDPFSELDNNGYRVLKAALAEQFPNVKIGLQSVFKDSKLEKVMDVTKPKTPEQLEEERKLLEAPPVVEEKNVKKGPAKAAAPSEPALALKQIQFTPHFVSLRTGPLPTMSQLMEFVRYKASLPMANQWRLIIDDKIFEE
jgi:hypothetical protein